MSPYLLIISLLLVFSFFTTSEIKRYINTSHSEKSFEALNDKHHVLEKLKKLSQLQDLHSTIWD